MKWLLKTDFFIWLWYKSVLFYNLSLYIKPIKRDNKNAFVLNMVTFLIIYIIFIYFNAFHYVLRTPLFGLLIFTDFRGPLYITF
jgi:hypothetical protein